MENKTDNGIEGSVDMTDNDLVSEGTEIEISKSEGTATTDKGLMVEGPNAKKAAQEIPPLTWKEMKALKKSKYEKNRHKYNKAFVIKNRRTGQIVELRAMSALQAASIIGWRPRHVVLIEEKVPEEILNQSPEAVEKRTADPVENKEVKRDGGPQTVATTPVDNCPGLKKDDKEEE